MDCLSTGLSVEFWAALLAKYSEALSKRAEKMKEPKRKEMLELDKWYQETLPGIIQTRAEKFISHSELAKLMKWKLSRGKFRPRLQQLVESNSEQEVEAASKKAFKKLPNLKAAITELTVLKAVGPATASAVLAAGSPEHAAFMADESMLALPDLKPLQYTMGFYLSFIDQVNEITASLKKEDESWTPHKVELALWTYHILKTSDPDSLSDLPMDKGSSAKKRKGGNESGNEATKKQKSQKK